MTMVESLDSRVALAVYEVRSGQFAAPIPDSLSVASLADKPDDYPVSIGVAAVRKPGEFLIQFGDDPAEMLDLLMLHDVRNLQARHVGRLQDILLHEEMHRDFALSQRAEGAVVGQRLRRHSPTGLVVSAGYFTRPYGWETTKLAVAAGYMRPDRPDNGPSPGDLRAVESMGYPGGVQQIGQLAVAHNEQLVEGQQLIPLPLTYSHSQ